MPKKRVELFIDGLLLSALVLAKNILYIFGENAIATADGKDCQAIEQPIADRNGTGVQTGARRGDGQLTGQRPFPRGISG